VSVELLALAGRALPSRCSRNAKLVSRDSDKYTTFTFFWPVCCNFYGICVVRVRAICAIDQLISPAMGFVVRVCARLTDLRDRLIVHALLVD